MWLVSDVLALVTEREWITVSSVVLRAHMYNHLPLRAHVLRNERQTILIFKVERTPCVQALLLRGRSMQKTQVGASLINTLTSTVYLCPYCRELVVWFTADVTKSVWPLAVLNHNNAVHIQQKRRLIVVSLLSLEWRHWYFRTAKHTKKWVVWFSRGAGLISQVMPTSRLPAAVSLLSLHDV